MFNRVGHTASSTPAPATSPSAEHNRPVSGAPASMPALPGFPARAASRPPLTLSVEGALTRVRRAFLHQPMPVRHNMPVLQDPHASQQATERLMHEATTLLPNRRIMNREQARQGLLDAVRELWQSATPFPNLEAARDGLRNHVGDLLAKIMINQSPVPAFDLPRARALIEALEDLSSSKPGISHAEGPPPRLPGPLRPHRRDPSDSTLTQELRSALRDNGLTRELLKSKFMFGKAHGRGARGLLDALARLSPSMTQGAGRLPPCEDILKTLVDTNFSKGDDVAGLGMEAIARVHGVRIRLIASQAAEGVHTLSRAAGKRGLPEIYVLHDNSTDSYMPLWPSSGSPAMPAAPSLQLPKPIRERPQDFGRDAFASEPAHKRPWPGER